MLKKAHETIDLCSGQLKWYRSVAETMVDWLWNLCVPFGKIILIYDSGKSMDICSKKMCKLLTDICHWNQECSYRIPGTIFPRQEIAVFCLLEAEEIEREL